MPEIIDAEPVRPPLIRNRWMRLTLLIAGTIAAIYGMIYVDVVLRARSAYMEAEKFMRWHQHPEQKSAELNARFDEEKRRLDRRLEDKKVSADEHARQLEVLEFDRRRNLEESSVKYAYVWYKTAYELFSPPESKWVRLSREKAPAAREEWKKELRSKNIPFEEYMLD